LTSGAPCVDDSLDEYDLVKNRKDRRKWIVLVIAGLSTIVACAALSVAANAGSATDVPNHDIVFSLPIMGGSALLAVGIIMIVLGLPSAKAAKSRRKMATLSVAVILATLVICGYILNPLISPVAILRDSDLDGVTDNSDFYPKNHSRIDHPWVSFWLHTSVSHTNDEWNVLVGEGGYSCWLDATAIQVWLPDNSTALERTLLTQMSEDIPQAGVRYYNTAKLDRLDEGDYFLIDNQVYADGCLIAIKGLSNYGWQTMTLIGLDDT